MFRAILLFARSLNRIAKSLEHIETLYRMDCEARGIVETQKGVHDMIEVSYESKPETLEDIWGR